MHCDVDEAKLRECAGSNLVEPVIVVSVWFRLPTASEAEQILRKGQTLNVGWCIRDLRVAHLITRWTWNGHLEPVIAAELSAIHRSFRTVMGYGLDRELERRGYRFGDPA